MAKLKDNWKSFKELFSAVNTENIFTLVFIAGLFMALVGFFWLIWLALVWLYTFSFPVWLLVLGLALMGITYLLSYLRK